MLRENEKLWNLTLVPDNFHYLLDIVTKKPTMDEIADHARCFKLPYSICDLFYDHDELLMQLLSEPTYLDYFFSFLWRKDDNKLPILCGYFSKIVKKMLEMKAQFLIDYILKDNFKVVKQLVELLNHYSICELLYTFLTTMENMVNGLNTKGSSNSNADKKLNNNRYNSDNEDEVELNDVNNIEAHPKQPDSDEDQINLDLSLEDSKKNTIKSFNTSEEALFQETETQKYNKKRMFVCKYIYARIEHEYGDSMVQHAANIMINTINRTNSDFSMNLVEELLKEDNFEKLLRNIIPFKYRKEGDTLTELPLFSVVCMKTSVSVVFNLVQIYISHSSQTENQAENENGPELNVDDNDYEDMPSDEKSQTPLKISFNSQFKTYITKYIPFLVSILKFYKQVDISHVAELESCIPYNKEVFAFNPYTLNTSVYENFIKNRLNLPSGSVQPLGLERFRLISFLGKIIYLNDEAVNYELYKSDYTGILLELMQFFENNSILHNTLTAIFKYILKNENNLLLLFNLLSKSQFILTILDNGQSEYIESSKGSNQYKSFLPHLISLSSYISMLSKEMLILQKYLGFFHTPRAELTQRHQDIVHNGKSMLSQVDQYLTKELGIDVEKQEADYNFELTYQKWVDFEENVLLKYLERESNSINDEKDDELLHKIISDSIGDSMSKHSPKNQTNDNDSDERYSGKFNHIFEDAHISEEMENFDREINEEGGDYQATFNFSNYDDDEIKLPDELFKNFGQRKNSNNSDDMVKMEGDGNTNLYSLEEGDENHYDHDHDNDNDTSNSDDKKGSPLQNISVDEDETCYKKDFESTNFYLSKNSKKNFFDEVKMDDENKDKDFNVKHESLKEYDSLQPYYKDKKDKDEDLLDQLVNGADKDSASKNRKESVEEKDYNDVEYWSNKNNTANISDEELKELL